jgi:hypothetical protein
MKGTWREFYGDGASRYKITIKGDEVEIECFAPQGEEKRDQLLQLSVTNLRTLIEMANELLRVTGNEQQ